MDKVTRQWIFKKTVDIQKACHKKLVTQVELHASAGSLLKRAENSAIIISDHHSINQSINHRQTDRERQRQTQKERGRRRKTKTTTTTTKMGTGFS